MPTPLDCLTGLLHLADDAITHTDEHDAADILQDTFLELKRRFLLGVSLDDIRRNIVLITRSVRYNRLRQSRRGIYRDCCSLCSSAEPADRDSIAEVEFADALGLALSRMPPKMRMAVLGLMEGKTRIVLAAELGMDRHCVALLIVRARQILAPLFGWENPEK